MLEKEYNSSMNFNIHNWRYKKLTEKSSWDGYGDGYPGNWDSKPDEKLSSPFPSVGENLRKWFKEEDWVRIDTQGNIAGSCGSNKKGKKTQRCLPRKKAQSLSKAERKATARKKTASKKQFVKNTKKAKVSLKKESMDKKDLKALILKTLEKEGGAAGLKALSKAAKTSKKDLEPKLAKMSGVKQHQDGDYISTPLNEASEQIFEMLTEKLCKKGKAYVARRKAAGEKHGAYLMGRAVKVCKGQMSGKKKKKKNELKVPHRKSGYMGYSEPVEETNMTIGEVLNMKLIDENITEAKYKGKTVKLNKPMRGDSKKFKVYVNSGKKNADGSIKVKKVNFGHGGTTAKKAGQKTMKIRKSNPKARAAFRKRHRCNNPGPKTMARYWSCKKW